MANRSPDTWPVRDHFDHIQRRGYSVRLFTDRRNQRILPHFRMGFTPSAGKELQSEYLVPRKNSVDAIMALEPLRDQITPHLLISEIRTIAADELWTHGLSPGKRGDSLHLETGLAGGAARVTGYREGTRPISAAPALGEVVHVTRRTPIHLREAGDLVKLATQYDPKGKFGNDFLNPNVFSM